MIKKKYNLLSTILLQHDVVFIFFLIHKGNLENEKYTFTKAKCSLLGLKKVDILNENNELFEKLAEICLMITYAFYIDSKIDNERKIFTTILENLFLKNFYESTKEIEHFEGDLSKFLELENGTKLTLSEKIHKMCEMYSQFIFLKLNKEINIVKSLYQMCKIMYYMDAIEDYEKDKRRSKENILNNISEDKAELIYFVREKIIEAISKIEIDDNRINKNILELSLQSRFNKIKTKLLKED